MTTPLAPFLRAIPGLAGGPATTVLLGDSASDWMLEMLIAEIRAISNVTRSGLLTSEQRLGRWKESFPAERLFAFPGETLRLATLKPEEVTRLRQAAFSWLLLPYTFDHGPDHFRDWDVLGAHILALPTFEIPMHTSWAIIQVVRPSQQSFELDIERLSAASEV